ncbi:hypothetical protein BGX23_008165 [Mortierella sp. AD031]|nr:hypothetical protein BGX23_008165 [Mortierella sp. AD031]
MTAETIDITLPNYGTIRGSVDTERQVAIFRNVPYAYAPERWRAAVKPQPWTGIRDATVQGPVPPQSAMVVPQTEMIPNKYREIGTNQSHQFGLEHSEHDCLNLNIFVPLSALKEGAKLIPVVTYIYGGSLRHGNNAIPFYNARNFVEHSVRLNQSVLVVQPNYRVAAFGFLASKELQEDMDDYVRNSPTPISLYDQSVGNWGPQDQKLAFEWVREDISTLDGDSRNVTAFGQSVGAISLHYHMVLPSHYGLFDRAIVQSGAIGTMSTGTVEQQGQPIFDRLLEAFGIPSDLSGLEKVKRLRAAPMDELTRASEIAGPRVGYRPIHDGGKVLPFKIPVEPWANLPSSYDPNLKSVMIGANKNEGYGIDADYEERNLKTWPKLLDLFATDPEFVPLFEAAYGIPRTDEEVVETIAEYPEDVIFNYPTERAVSALVQMSKARKERFRLERYHFDIETEETSKVHPNAGAMHDGELLFIFNPPMAEDKFTKSELAAALKVQIDGLALSMDSLLQLTMGGLHMSTGTRLLFGRVTTRLRWARDVN